MKFLNNLCWQLEKLGVQINLGKRATAATVEELQPDTVIVAAGAVPLVPPIAGVKQERVITAWDVLRGHEVGQRVLVVGGGMTGVETAEYLAQQGKEVVVVEQLKRIGADMGGTVRWHLMNRLKGQKVELLASTQVKEIGPQGAVTVLRNGREETLRGFETIVLACGARPRNELATQIEGKVKELYIIGDAAKARKGLDALREGAEVGRKV